MHRRVLPQVHDGQMEAEALHRLAQFGQASIGQIGAAVMRQRVRNHRKVARQFLGGSVGLRLAPRVPDGPAPQQLFPRAGKPRVSIGQRLPVGLVGLVHRGVRAVRGQRGQSFAHRHQLVRQRQLRAQLVHLFEIMVEDDSRQVPHRIIERRGGHEGIAVAVAAHPGADAKRGRQRAFQPEKGRELALHHGQLRDEGARHDRGRVVDLVGHPDTFRAQHARLPQGADFPFELGLDLGALGLVRGVMMIGGQQIGDGGFPVDHALAPHLRRMGGDHGRDQRSAEIGVNPLRCHFGMGFQLFQRPVVVAFGFAADDIVVGDIGELREDGEGADEDRQIAVRQMAELPDEGDRRAPLAVLVDDVAPQILHAVEGRLAVLLADDVAELASQQAHRLAAGGARRLRGDEGEMPFSHDVNRIGGGRRSHCAATFCFAMHKFLSLRADR